eukprot:1273983-Pyramimonas_sp.AAC.1
MLSPISGVGSKMRASFLSLTVFFFVVVFLPPSDGSLFNFKSISEAQAQDVRGNIRHEEHLEQSKQYARRQQAAVLYFKHWNIWNETTDVTNVSRSAISAI